MEIFQNISEFYFPHYIYLFFNKIFGVPFIWNYIVHFMFGGIGCVLLLKRLKVDNLSAIFGGLAFIFTPYLITMVAVLFIQFCSYYNPLAKKAENPTFWGVISCKLQ